MCAGTASFQNPVLDCDLCDFSSRKLPLTGMAIRSDRVGTDAGTSACAVFAGSVGGEDQHVWTFKTTSIVHRSRTTTAR
jgi:hypothetical protein